MKARKATIVVSVVATIGKVTSRVPVAITSTATLSLARRESLASSARSRAIRRRWMASSTRILLSRMRPKQTVNPLMVMKLTERRRK